MSIYVTCRACGAECLVSSEMVGVPSEILAAFVLEIGSGIRSTTKEEEHAEVDSRHCPERRPNRGSGG